MFSQARIYANNIFFNNDKINEKYKMIIWGLCFTAFNVNQHCILCSGNKTLRGN